MNPIKAIYIVLNYLVFASIGKPYPDPRTMEAIKIIRKRAFAIKKEDRKCLEKE